ncbi:hypothetical protein PN441_12055 [Spirulina major CS-329]|uniref:hypothetical protein n=1 Tax=Spirulina TaxID=1154 RepID=UPI002330E56B|nr:MULTISPECIES: hypothetical protein [Spirulina]MDB9496632.1 hypothetical protein [Spirulina subsalsa CS-330]MDB9503807.1 hypothetical protein [Spirulina major CS-329]
MMKPKNHWTRRLALLTLTLGTLAEGSALAALPQTSASQQNRQDISQRELAQRFPQTLQSQCAFLDTTTEMVTEDGNPIQLPSGTYVKILSPSPNAQMIRVHSFAPPRIGVIRSEYLGRVDFCSPDIVFPAPSEPEESYQCFEVIVDGTLPIYAADNTNIKYPNNPVVRNRDFIFFIERVRPDSSTYWVNFRPVPGRRNTPTEAGWILISSDRVELNQLSEGVCD